MAAETSADAHVPVMLALAKLGIYFTIEYIREVIFHLFFKKKKQLQ